MDSFLFVFFVFIKIEMMFCVGLFCFFLMMLVKNVVSFFLYLFCFFKKVFLVFLFLFFGVLIRRLDYVLNWFICFEGILSSLDIMIIGSGYEKLWIRLNLFCFWNFWISLFVIFWIFGFYCFIICGVKVLFIIEWICVCFGGFMLMMEFLIVFDCCGI